MVRLIRTVLYFGIDHYDAPNRLNGCVKDVMKMANVFAINGDGSLNFLPQVDSSDL